MSVLLAARADATAVTLREYGIAEIVDLTGKRTPRQLTVPNKRPVSWLDVSGNGRSVVLVCNDRTHFLATLRS